MAGAPHVVTCSESISIAAYGLPADTSASPQFLVVSNTREWLGVAGGWAPGEIELFPCSVSGVPQFPLHREASRLSVLIIVPSWHLLAAGVFARD